MLEDERQLWERYQAGENVENELVLTYKGYVYKTASTFLSVNHVCYDDIVSAGMLILLKRIRTFEVERGKEFIAWAIAALRGGMVDTLRELSFRSRLTEARTRELNKFRLRYFALRGRMPSEKLEMRCLGERVCSDALRPAMFIEGQHTAQWQVREGYQNKNLFDNIRGKADDPAEVCAGRDSLRSMIAKLSRREQLMILLRFEAGLTMKEIGKVVGLTESRVSQISTITLQVLKSQLSVKERVA